MSRFDPEPKRAHDSPSGTGILLVNLGTPQAPTPRAVRRYLKQFLSDPRVIELPRALWWPILNGVVLNTRPAHSARKYARIWTAEGSPLMVHTRRLADSLRARLAEAARESLAVDFAMRYGEPSIPRTLRRLKSENCDRILVVPLYPQYASSTTGSVLDEVAAFVQRARAVPAIRTIGHFHVHPAYIAALASVVREHWRDRGRPDKLLMSFHGLPHNSIERGDPYHDECRMTARLLAETLQLDEAHWALSFQSRFGRLEWLKPYTSSMLADYGRQGLRRVDVVCPGFVSDCLETLEEIGIEGKQTFLAAGGREFCLLPCLNEGDEWVHALAQIVREHLDGWLDETGRDRISGA